MTVTVDGTNGVTVPLGLLAVQPLVTTFTSSGTYTPRASSTIVQVLIIGAGGGGFGGTYAAIGGGSGGGGGGAARYDYQTFRTSDLTASVAVNIGAGGAGGPGIVIVVEW